MNDQMKNIADVTAGTVTIAAFLGYLPAIAAALTILYTLVRLWESATVRRLLRAVCERCAAWWER